MTSPTIPIPESFRLERSVKQAIDAEVAAWRVRNLPKPYPARRPVMTDAELMEWAKNPMNHFGIME
jgi:hypothetical protein